MSYVTLRFLYLCLMMIICQLNASVLIITSAYNRPDFIGIQDKLYKKFLADDYEMVIFNNGPTEEMRLEIDAVCQDLNIRSIRIPREIQESIQLKVFSIHSRQCGNSLGYALKTIGYQHDDLVAVIDSDLFLVKPFSFRELIGDNSICALMMEYDGLSKKYPHIEHCWSGFTILAMPTLPNKTLLNFDCVEQGKGKINLDTGGQTWKYMLKHASLKVKSVDTLYGCQFFCPYDLAFFSNSIKKEEITADMNLTRDEKIKALKKLKFNDIDIKFILKKPHTIQYVCENKFFHYRASSRWTDEYYNDAYGDTFHQDKTKLVDEYLNDILTSDIPK